MTSKINIAIIAAVYMASAAAADKAPFSIESDVIETEGSAKDIARRAKICAVQHLRNDKVEMGDAMGARRDSDAPGGDVLVSDDLEAGIVVANSRAPFRYMLSQWSAQSLVTVLARDGRFKIQHTNVKAAMLSTGYSNNDGYQPVGERLRVEKPVAKALGELSVSLAQCIKAKSTDW